MAAPLLRPTCREVRSGLPGEHWPLGRLTGKLLQRLREMIAVVQEEDTPGAPLHEKGDQRSIGLRRVALPAGQNQIVRTVIRRLSTARPDMVEGDSLR
jgi:hypothetical protein